MKDKKISWRSVIHIIFKILSWALFIILLLIAIFLIYYYIANRIYMKKGAGYEPKFSIYTIATGSMVPNINVYDAVINMRVEDPSDLKVGDVITFRSSSSLTPNMTITHRIKAISEDEETGEICFITKGDANPVEDDSCTKHSNIIGKVIIRIPGLGHIQRFLASGFGWLLCILIPALVIIARDIMKLTRLATIKDNAIKISNKKKKDPKKEQAEKKRKEQIKRNLLSENTETKEYYEEPSVKVIEKNEDNSKKENNKQKRKKKD